MGINRLNIRVYGILEHQQKILLVREKIDEFEFTKFPGGGLELGEGTRDCLIREFLEETGLQIECGEHFYTTDFFQQSYFRETDQIISVYYRVNPLSDISVIPTEEVFIEQNGKKEQLRFFWVTKEEFHPGMLRFPIDKHVAELLL